ncbi:M56 family metallopeptidase [Nonomuraea lactucae]|uniref:M56 family metallopeptidase n=1 Tax=Nonomuraea lactucae TaxID=2249762 RepID=UPI000DE1B42E|nr:M56 family metallopeptidase [Nonomuraea lactucae]
MTAAVLLTAYALVLAAVAPAALQRASWVHRAPRQGIMAWQSLSIAVVAAVVLAGLSVAVPASAWGADLARALNACVMMLRDSYATPQGGLAITAALLASAAITARLTYSLGAELIRTWRERRRHLAVLRMVARRDERLGVLVVDHGAAIAYCLRGGPIVLSTSTLAALDERRLAAVLAHERAHLHGRHHVLTATARGLRRAFPFVALFATAEQEIDRLTELVADDDAVHATAARHRQPVHRRLVSAAAHSGSRVLAMTAGRASAWSSAGHDHQVGQPPKPVRSSPWAYHSFLKASLRLTRAART